MVGFVKGWYHAAGYIVLTFKVKKMLFQCLKFAVGQFILPCTSGEMQKVKVMSLEVLC